jgi:hypothetical protein
MLEVPDHVKSKQTSYSSLLLIIVQFHKNFIRQDMGPRIETRYNLQAVMYKFLRNSSSGLLYQLLSHFPDHVIEIGCAL